MMEDKLSVLSEKLIEDFNILSRDLITDWTQLSLSAGDMEFFQKLIDDFFTLADSLTGKIPDCDQNGFATEYQESPSSPKEISKGFEHEKNKLSKNRDLFQKKDFEPERIFNESENTNKGVESAGKGNQAGSFNELAAFLNRREPDKKKAFEGGFEFNHLPAGTNENLNIYIPTSEQFVPESLTVSEVEHKSTKFEVQTGHHEGKDFDKPDDKVKSIKTKTKFWFESKEAKFKKSESGEGNQTLKEISKGFEHEKNKLSENRDLFQKKDFEPEQICNKPEDTDKDVESGRGNQAGSFNELAAFLNRRESDKEKAPEGGFKFNDLSAGTNENLNINIPTSEQFVPESLTVSEVKHKSTEFEVQTSHHKGKDFDKPDDKAKSIKTKTKFWFESKEAKFKESEPESEQPVPESLALSYVERRTRVKGRHNFSVDENFSKQKQRQTSEQNENSLNGNRLTGNDTKPDIDEVMDIITDQIEKEYKRFYGG